ncbi:LOW QUALITY PROTEIN: hypothetical protein OPAG_05235, partial [Rhodococcus opacus PD630]
ERASSDSRGNVGWTSALGATLARGRRRSLGRVIEVRFRCAAPRLGLIGRISVVPREVRLDSGRVLIAPGRGPDQSLSVMWVGYCGGL